LLDSLFYYAVYKLVLKIMIHEMKIYKRTCYNRPRCYVIGIFSGLVFIVLHTGICYVCAPLLQTTVCTGAKWRLHLRVTV
jgi:hypothetical protein